MPLTEDAIQNMFVGRPVFHPSRVGVSLAAKNDSNILEIFTEVRYVDTYISGSAIKSHESLTFKVKVPRKIKNPIHLVYTGLDDKIVWWQDRPYYVARNDTVHVYVSKGEIFVLT